MTWDYDGANIIYLLSKEKNIYYVDIVQLLEDLLYKEILMTFYLKTECVMDAKQMLVA